MIKKPTTMIGSLPHAGAEEALELLDRYPLTIPAWPQLPKRTFLEAMIPQYTEGFPGVKADGERKSVWLERDDALLDAMAGAFEAIVAENHEAFAVSEGYAAGLHAFLKKYKGQGVKLPAAKGHITGPFTFGLGLNDNDKKAIWFDEQYRDIIYKGLALKAAWQVQALQQIAEKVYLFADEPILSALGTPAYMGIEDEEVVNALNEVYTAIQAAGGITGTHCCGNMDWGLLARTKVDIIAFDAFFYADKVALYPEEINAFLERGGHLAWGIVPTSSSEVLAETTADILQQKIEKSVRLFTDKGIAEEKLLSNMLYTPSCGIGSLGVDDAPKVLDLLAQLAG